MLEIKNIDKYENEFYIKLGTKLKSFRVEKNISQKQIGTILGITFQQIQKYELGINKIPFSRLVMICNIYKVDLISDYLDINSIYKKKLVKRKWLANLVFLVNSIRSMK